MTTPSTGGTPFPPGYNPTPGTPAPPPIPQAPQPPSATPHPPSASPQPPAYPGKAPGPGSQASSQSIDESTTDAPTKKTSFQDPAGIWQRWLSMSGTQASPQEVQMFLNTLLKYFSSTILAQSNQAAKREAEQLKKAIEGDED